MNRGIIPYNNTYRCVLLLNCTQQLKFNTHLRPEHPLLFTILK